MVLMTDTHGVHGFESHPAHKASLEMAGLFFYAVIHYNVTNLAGNHG